MAGFDNLVDLLTSTFDRVVSEKLPAKALSWLAVGAEEEALYLAFSAPGSDSPSLIALLDHGFADAESDAYEIAGYRVVDFDAIEQDEDFWNGRVFILQCALPFVALELERRVRAGKYTVEPASDFSVGVFDDLNACGIQAYAPTFYLAMPEDEFLSEFDQHCDDDRYVDYLQHILEGGWTGDAINLARKVTRGD